MKYIILILCFLLLSCAAKKELALSAVSDTRTQNLKFINENTFLLSERTTDSTYGYSQNNPVKVGGIKQDEGPLNQKRFLNALLGPQNQTLLYYRERSCCFFDTPNGILNETGLLDEFHLYWKGSSDTLILYLNMYDEGNLYIPVGLNARK